MLDEREHNPSGAYRQIRTGTLTRLGVAATLLPASTGLLVIEGWRDPDDQQRRFTSYLHRLRAAEPDLDETALRTRTSKFVSPAEVAPHCTGGAVDLTLADLTTHSELDMGGAVNAHRTGDERSCPFSAPGLRPAARARRRTLAAAMTSAGFVNYPTEWWHWSFGDRYWAAMSAAPAAIYGPVTFGQPAST
jgi:D-alanyl-D-alanine dipeptidase